MADKRKKRKKKTKGAPASGSGVAPSSGGGHSGGVLQSMRSGFRRVAGAEGGAQEESTLSKVVWGLILAAAVAFAVTRWLGLWGGDGEETESAEETAEEAERTPEKAPTKAASSPDQGDQSGNE